MIDKLSILWHPSRWSVHSAAELADGERIAIALAILVASVLVAGLAGWASGRWTRGRGAADGRGQKLRRTLIQFLIFVGVYLAVDMAPFPTKVASVLGGILFVLAAIAGARVVIQIVSQLLTASVAHVSENERRRVEREFVPLVDKIMTLATGLVVLILVAKHFGQDLTSLVAALGIGSLAIGLAAQQTLGNMFAGFVLLVDRPFRPGDRIRLGTGEEGEVLQIGVRSTKIRVNDRDLLIVPNTDLANSRVLNYSLPLATAHGEVRVSIEDSAKVEPAMTILKDAALADEKIVKTPEPTSRILTIAHGEIQLSVGFDVPSALDLPDAQARVRLRVLQKLAGAQIKISAALMVRPS